MAETKRLPLILALLLTSFLLPAHAEEEVEDDWAVFETSIEVPQNVDDATYLDDDEGPTPVTTIKQHQLRRRIMREDIVIRIKTLRLDSGKKVQLVYGAPKKADSCPAVFVMDVEANLLANKRSFAFSSMSKKKKQDLKEAAYLLRSPFGSNMLGNGFAVAYVIAEDLESIRSARTADWLGMFSRVRAHKQTDPNSIFLFSTREWANTSVLLASKYDFKGFILEEPGYLLFSQNTYEDIIKKSSSLSSADIWRRTDPTREQMYYDVLSRITTPILLIRNKGSNAFAFNEKILIPKLVEANAFFETVVINGPSRNLTIFGGRQGALRLEPEVAFYPKNTNEWVQEMVSYVKANSATEAIALRDPSNYRSW